jgi:septal ring-binding cell division protein DamX
VVSASEAVPQPTSASGERAPVESLPEPAPATASPTVVAAPAESPAAAPDRPTPVEAAPSAPAAAVETPATAPARRAAPTSELPDSGYVIQLARGSSNHGFEQIRGKLKLDRQRAPEIRVGSAAAPEHVLLWSGFADSKTAQAALNKLPKGTAPGAWVRSVESLRPLLVDADAAPVRSVATVSEAAAPVSAAERRPAVPAAAPAAPAVEPPPPAAASAVPVAPASPAARVGSLSNTTVAAFAALPGNHYAVQLARAHSTAGFAPLIGTLGIPENSVYSVPVKTTGKLEYLLLWADFPSVEAARAAAARLPASAVQGALARRIGPLQEEARGAR